MISHCAYRIVLYQEPFFIQIILYLNMPNNKMNGSEKRSLNQHQILSHVELNLLFDSHKLLLN